MTSENSLDRNARLETARGLVEVRWQETEQDLTVEAIVPAGVTGVIRLPGEREPRVSTFFSSAPKTLLAIEDMEVGNVGILLDFGHSLYGGESPAEAARLIHSRGLLYAIDVNDNFPGLGRRPHSRLSAPHRNPRVLLHASRVRLAGRLATRPVPFQGRFRRGGTRGDHHDA